MTDTANNLGAAKEFVHKLVYPFVDKAEGLTGEEHQIHEVLRTDQEKASQLLQAVGIIRSEGTAVDKQDYELGRAEAGLGLWLRERAQLLKNDAEAAGMLNVVTEEILKKNPEKNMGAQRQVGER